MESKNMIGGIVSLAVVVICVAAIMMPVLDDATTTEETFTNEGYYDVTYTESDSLTLSWEYTSPHQVTVNDEVIALEESPAAGRTILCGDDWLIRYTGDGITLYSSSGSAAGATTSNEGSVALTAEEGTMSWTSTYASLETVVTKTNSYTYLYVVDADGEYVMKESGESAYLLGDSEIYAMGLSSISTLGDVYLKASGTKDDGITATVFRYSSSTEVTVDDVSAEFTTLSDYVDLYTLDEFVVTVTDGTNTADVTYSYFIVPAEVTAERAVHFTDGENALINAIPVLIIVSIVIAALGIAVTSRRD